jgi:hypothetical protein
MKIKLTIEVPKWLDGLLIAPVLEYRRRHYGFAFRRIRLTLGKYAIVDPEDYWALSKYDWFAVPSSSIYYAMRNDFTRHKYAPVSMHRMVLAVDKGLVVDHINGNGLDERKANLRGITEAQNRLNRHKHAKASSKFKGVSRHKRTERWMAYISVNSRRMFLGYFDDEGEAARVYDEAAKKYHGEFARLNFPQESVSLLELCGIA